MEVLIELFERCTIVENLPCHFRIPMKARPMERSCAMLAGCLDRQTSRKHEAHGRKVIVPGRVGDLMPIGAEQSLSSIGVIAQEALNRAVVAQPARCNQPHFHWAAFHLAGWATTARL